MSRILEEKIKELLKHHVKPWIGENYKHTSPRLLIVMESHYHSAGGTDPVSPTKITECVESYLAGNNFNRVYPNLSDFFRGSLWEDKENKRGYFNNIAFFNFCEGQINRPEKGVSLDKNDLNHQAMLEAGKRSFFKRVEEISPLPERIIFYSIKAWHAFEDLIRNNPEYKEKWLGYPKDDNRSYIRSIEFNGKNIITMGTTHPSNYRYKHEKRQETLKNFTSQITIDSSL